VTGPTARRFTVTAVGEPLQEVIKALRQAIGQFPGR
jgi:hypothetical protein